MFAMLMTAAQATEFLVNDQDQQNIMAICDAAALSPNLNREARANVASWCLAWQKRMSEAKDKK